MTAKRAIRQPHRRSGRRGPELRTVHIVAEGQATEQRYFKGLRQHYSGRLNINVAPHRGETAPRQLIQQAIALRTKLQRDGDHGDRVWVVCDGDGRPPAEISALHTQAHNHHLQLAISTPCIEQWFLLHLDQPLSARQRDAQAAKRAFYRHEQIGGNERLDERVVRILRDRQNIDRAVSRARELKRRHHQSGDPETHNPSSSLWRLIEEFERLARPELVSGS